MYMKQLVLICFFILMAFSAAFAQKKGSVEVTKDPRIDSLIAKRIELGKTGNSKNAGTVNGFRVQLFSGVNRKEAYALQAEFKSMYPDVKSYISYTQPNYKIRVGDFRTRLEAEKFMSELKKQFTGVFIFSEPVSPK